MAYSDITHREDSPSQEAFGAHSGLIGKTKAAPRKRRNVFFHVS